MTRIDSFARRLQAARKRRDMTQGRLAVLADLDSTVIAHYEAGDRQPGADAIRRICRALDVTADFLLALGDETRRINA